MRHSADGGSARLWDAVVLDSGCPDLSVRVVEVEASAGETLLTGTFDARAVAVLKMLRHGFS
jgi:hypothetical protein